MLVDLRSDPSSSRIIFSLMQTNYKHRIFVSADGIYLFKRGYGGESVKLAPYVIRYNPYNILFYSGERVEGFNSTSGVVLLFNGSKGSVPILWYTPRGILPPGNYTVTLRLMISPLEEDLEDEEIFTLEICSDNGQSVVMSRSFRYFDLQTVNRWVNQTVTLVIEKPLIDFEIRVINPVENIVIYLDYIEIFENIPGE